MPKNLLILGIESSCDDTSVALVRDSQLLDCIVISSAELQAKFGGVVPELAAREHERKILLLLDELLHRTGIYWREITHIAYADKPGLIGCLLVGRVFAKTLAWIHKKPLIPVDHIHGHIFSVGLTDPITFPALALVISGKTTAIYHIRSFSNIEMLDATEDNALGEVYDKVARELGLSYPGGPAIDALFNPDRKVIDLLKNRPNPAKKFSYSGILSAVMRLCKALDASDMVNKEEYIATVFQRWVVDELIRKIKYWTLSAGVNTLYVSGGVSANKFLRSELEKLDLKVYLVDPRFACDNAAMIAYYAAHLIDK